MWLDPQLTDKIAALKLISGIEYEPLQVRAVSTAVNKTGRGGSRGPELIEPIGEYADQPLQLSSQPATSRRRVGCAPGIPGLSPLVRGCGRLQAAEPGHMDGKPPGHVPETATSGSRTRPPGGRPAPMGGGRTRPSQMPRARPCPTRSRSANRQHRRYTVGDMSGQVAVVTGGTRGIGLAISERLLNRGVTVAAGDATHHDHAREFEDKYAVRGVSVHQGNVGHNEDVLRVFGDILDRHGHVDIVVNNAGITIDKTVRRMEAEEADDVIHVNLSGAFYMSRACCSTRRTAVTAGSSTFPRRHRLGGRVRAGQLRGGQVGDVWVDHEPGVPRPPARASRSTPSRPGSSRPT